MFNTPILLLIFNRPEQTEKVFNEIRKQQPKYLYISTDGPRENHPEDAELIKKCKLIVSNIDWDCEVKTLYREKNLGCGAAPANAITWFFDHVDEGIILEDDVFPDKTFFTFCEEMLKQYKNNPQIMHISGCYFLDSYIPSSIESYYFTKHIHVWGWATWKRAWVYYDYDMSDHTYLDSKKLINYYNGYAIFWKDIFKRMVHKGNDIWDYQWMYAIYSHNGVAVNPTVNLTKNIGFVQNATHTKDEHSAFTKIKLSSMTTLEHSEVNTIDENRDALYYKHFLDFDLQAEIYKRNFLWKLKKLLRELKKRFQRVHRFPSRRNENS